MITTDTKLLKKEFVTSKTLSEVS